MYKLILNPKKILSRKKENYFFLGKWFINFIDKKLLNKIKYKYTQDKHFNFNLKKEIKNKKKNKIIYKIILLELYPLLNKIHSINWNLKTWNFFIGHWLHFYIFLINERLNLIKNLNFPKLNIKDQLSIGKKTWLVNYNLRDYTYDTGLIKWNEKLISRIIYLLKTKNFSNEENIKLAEKFLPTKNQKLTLIISYNIKNFFLKIFVKIFCKNNNIIFYNSYFKNKLKLIKLLIKLKNFPFIYSYSFFNNYVIKAGVKKDLRKKIKLNLKIKDLNLKIIKFLIPEMIPTIFLEGFNKQLILAKNSYLPKKINKVFISSSLHINSFKFWLAEKLNIGTKLFHGQHGGGHNIFKHWFGDEYESNISKKFFTWGSRKKFKNNISIGNFLLDNNNIKINYNKKLLLVLPAPDIYRRSLEFRYLNDFDERISQVQSFIDNLNYNNIKKFSIRPHPQNDRRELKFENFFKFHKKSNIIDTKHEFQEISKKSDILIFTYLSTEFFSQIALNKPCFILFNKQFYLNNYLTSYAKKDFKKLYKIGILHLEGKTLAKKINNTINDFEKWWCNKKVKTTRINFCKNYSNPIFDEKKFIKILSKN